MKDSSLSDKQVSENAGSRDNCLCRFSKVGCSHCHCQQVRTICPENPDKQDWTDSDTAPPSALGKHKEREQRQVGHSLETQQKILPPAPHIQQVART